MEYTILITVNVISKDVLAATWGRSLSKGTGYFVFGFFFKISINIDFKSSFGILRIFLLWKHIYIFWGNMW